MLHRLGLVYRRPTPIGRGLDALKQQAFIDAYEKLSEFAWPRRGDAVRGRRASHLCGAVCSVAGRRPERRWPSGRPSGRRAAQHSRRARSRNRQDRDDRGRKRRCGLDDQPARSHRGEVSAAQPRSTYSSTMRAITMLSSCGNGWRNPGRRIRLRFIPSYSPHLNPIERLWGVMHKHLTHNKCCARLSPPSPKPCCGFLREQVPRCWAECSATWSPTTSASSIPRIFGF